METFEIAHIREQDVDVVVVFVNESISHKSPQDQNALAAYLQACAASANLAGNIAMVWPGGFWAPRNQHAFFQSQGGSYYVLAQSINRKLTCN